MAPRAISTGTISFGLVSIPVKLYSASESSGSISFNMLHGKCRSRLKQQYVCPTDNEIVTRDQMVKGYEFAKDQYVVFTEEELKAMEEEGSKAIDIVEFVPAAQVDPIYFDRAYYLGPDKGGDRAYKLLAESMRRTGRSALASWSARGKQHLVLVRAVEGGLVMQQLHYADEVRPISEVPVGDAELKEAEVKLATQLIDQISSDEFKPQKYEDGARKAMQDAIQRKIEGREVTAATEKPRGQIIDLMEALKASLGAKDTAAAAAAPEEASAAPPDEERKPTQRAPRTAKKRAGGEQATG